MPKPREQVLGVMFSGAFRLLPRESSRSSCNRRIRRPIRSSICIVLRVVWEIITCSYQRMSGEGTDLMELLKGTS